MTSFVRPDVIPQLADAEQVLEAITLPADGRVSVLIPNERGLERRARGTATFQEINGFLSASETHNQKNVGRAVAESLAGLERTFARARAEGLRCEGVISTSFGCPYEGHVPVERVLELAARAAEAGAQEVAFGDTTGMANPLQVRSSSRRRSSGCPASSSPRTSTTPAARDWPTCSRRWRRAWRASSRASASSAAARCHRARPATSPPRTWSRCSTRWGSQTGVDLGALLAASRAVQQRARAGAREPRADGRPRGVEVADGRTGARGRCR